MPPKIRDIIEQLQRDGWTQVATRGSHRQFKPGQAGPGDSGRQTGG